MRWLTSDNITTTHGFSTRHGGVSQKPFESLNLGGKDDLPESVAENRRLALQDLQIDFTQVSYLNQIHSNIVCKAKVGLQIGDALVTNEQGLALAIGAADCYPVLFFDKVNQVIGAAHCGWRGTLHKIVANTITEMQKLGAETPHIKMAIGQGISCANYEVSNNVISEFRQHGFPESCYDNNHLNLLKANKFVALQNNILAENIWSINRCTTEPDFFSYRRDKGLTGRMWGVIML